MVQERVCGEGREQYIPTPKTVPGYELHQHPLPMASDF